jgi:hypothetical protein
VLVSFQDPKERGCLLSFFSNLCVTFRQYPEAMNTSFDLRPVHIVGFSSQRSLRNPGAMLEELRNQLKKMELPERRLMAISSLAGPTDLLFAKEAIDQEIPLVLILTASRENLRQSFSGPDALAFDEVLNRATQAETLARSPEVEATTHVGQRLVDGSDVLIAVSDYTETQTAGDTAEVISYALRRGRPVIHLKESTDGVSVRELSPEHDQSENQESILHLEKLLGEPLAPAVIPDELFDYFKACDKQATNTAPKVRRYALNIVLANAVAAVAGSVYSSFHHSEIVGIILTVIKFGCFLLGLVIFAVLKHRQSRNHWLGWRLKAEVCRSAIATWSSPIPVEPLTADEVPELRDLIQSLRYFRALYHKAHGEISLEAFKASYGTRRLIDQYRYFHSQALSAANMSGRLSPIYWLFNTGALIVSGFTLVLQGIYGQTTIKNPSLNYLFIMLPAMAPAIASWIISWQALESVGRKKARFMEMEKLMHQSLVDLVHAHTWEAVQHVVKKAERQLLREVLEWHSFLRFT